MSAAIRSLFHRLRALSEEVPAPVDGFSASHRGVLESLTLDGPATVPALARARPVTRQHIQALVNDLLAWDLVRTAPNPAHRRSPLLDVTPRGRAAYERLRAREAELLATLRLPCTVDELAMLADRLEALSSALAKRG